MFDCISNCCLQLVDLFCNHDADLLATDQYGMTSLHHAARFGHKGIVKYLVDNGKERGYTQSMHVHASLIQLSRNMLDIYLNSLNMFAKVLLNTFMYQICRMVGIFN